VAEVAEANLVAISAAKTIADEGEVEDEAKAEDLDLLDWLI